MKRFVSMLFAVVFASLLFCFPVFAVPNQWDFSLAASDTQVALFPYFSGGALPQSQTVFSSTAYNHGQNSSASWYTENGYDRYYLSQYFEADFNVMAVVAGFAGDSTYSGTFKFSMTFTPSLLLWSNDSTWTSEGTNISGVNIEFLGCENVQWRPDTASTTSATGYLVISDKYFANNAGIGDGLLLPFKVTVRGYTNQQAATNVGTHPAQAKFAFNTFKMTSGYMYGVHGKYDPSTQQVVNNQNAIASSQASLSESQHDDLVNGYNNSSGSSAMESGASNVESGVASEGSALESAGASASDFDYDSVDLGSLATAFSLISGWFTSLITALGSWNMLIMISLTMVVALFAVGYFRNK